MGVKSDEYKAKYLELRQANPSMLDKQIAYEMGIKPNTLSIHKKKWGISESTTVSVAVNDDTSERVLALLGVSSSKEQEEGLHSEIVHLQKEAEHVRNMADDVLAHKRNRLMSEYMVLNLSRRKQQELLAGKIMSNVENIVDNADHSSVEKEMLLALAVVLKSLTN